MKFLNTVSVVLLATTPAMAMDGFLLDPEPAGGFHASIQGGSTGVDSEIAKLILAAGGQQLNQGVLHTYQMSGDKSDILSQFTTEPDDGMVPVYTLNFLIPAGDFVSYDASTQSATIEFRGPMAEILFEGASKLYPLGGAFQSEGDVKPGPCYGKSDSVNGFGINCQMHYMASSNQADCLVNIFDPAKAPKPAPIVTVPVPVLPPPSAQK